MILGFLSAGPMANGLMLERKRCCPRQPWQTESESVQGKPGNTYESNCCSGEADQEERTRARR